VRYVAAVIVLNRRLVIRVQSVTARGRFLVGYFTKVEAISDSGRRIDLADVELAGSSLRSGCQDRLTH
jgi:hypothetical protein